MVCPQCGDPNPVTRLYTTTELVTVRCYWCVGTGTVTHCAWCYGTGKYKETFMYEGYLYEGHVELCGMCSGTGKVAHTCQHCGGRGLREEITTVEKVQMAQPALVKPRRVKSST